jgi:hypothetical protein
LVGFFSRHAEEKTINVQSNTSAHRIDIPNLSSGMSGDAALMSACRRSCARRTQVEAVALSEFSFVPVHLKFVHAETELAFVHVE